MLAVVACFALPLLGMGALDGRSRGHDPAMTMTHYGIAFLFYVVQFFVIYSRCCARNRASMETGPDAYPADFQDFATDAKARRIRRRIVTGSADSEHGLFK